MMNFLALDFCTLCGGYDTIQSYIPVDKENKIWIHVCEKCFKKGEDKIRYEFIKTHMSSAYGEMVTKDTRG